MRRLALPAICAMVMVQFAQAEHHHYHEQESACNCGHNYDTTFPGSCRRCGDPFAASLWSDYCATKRYGPMIPQRKHCGTGWWKGCKLGCFNGFPFNLGKCHSATECVNDCCNDGDTWGSTSAPAAHIPQYDDATPTEPDEDTQNDATDLDDSYPADIDLPADPNPDPVNLDDGSESLQDDAPPEEAVEVDEDVIPEPDAETEPPALEEGAKLLPPALDKTYEQLKGLLPTSEKSRTPENEGLLPEVDEDSLPLPSDNLLEDSDDSLEEDSNARYRYYRPRFQSFRRRFDR